MASGTIPTLSKTISIDWSDGDGNFGSVISSSGSDKNYKLPISTLNAAIASAGIPADATVTGISITYTMWIQCSAKGEFKYDTRIGDSVDSYAVMIERGSITGSGRDNTKTTTTSLEVIRNQHSLNQVANGSNIIFRIYSSAWGKKTYKVYDVKLNILYQEAQYICTFKNYDGTYLTSQQITSGGTPSTPTIIPKRAQTISHIYMFSGWSPSLSSPVKSNTEYIAQYTEILKQYRAEVSVKPVYLHSDKWEASCDITNNNTDYNFGSTIELLASNFSPWFNFYLWSYAYKTEDGNTKYIQSENNPLSITFNEEFITSTIDYTKTTIIPITCYLQHIGFNITLQSFPNKTYGKIIVEEANDSINYKEVHDSEKSNIFNLDHGFESRTRITAIPKEGYRFLKWSDGDTSNPRSLADVEDNITFTAEFERIYYDVNYDNLLSFSDWAYSKNAVGAGSGTGTVDVNLQDRTITIEGEGDFYTKYSSDASHYRIPVEGGKTYIFKYDSTTTDGQQAFVFFINKNNEFVYNEEGTYFKGAYNGEKIIFKTPAECTSITFRVGITGTSKAIFSNLVICEESHDYQIDNIQSGKIFEIGNSVGELYTPIRKNFKFTGWVDKNGNLINSSSTFSESTTIFSTWELDKINKIKIGDSYIEKSFIDLDPVKIILIDDKKVYG